jgi:hypothetical protein
LKLEIGHSYLKLDLHRAFGGNARAGIAPTPSGRVLIFSDPDSGIPFGYDQNDGVVANIYRYTGEGQVGDQQLIRGNKALLSGGALLLFCRQDSKSWIFVGEVGLDSTPFELTTAPDIRGLPRTVIVFRFTPKNANFGFLKRN